MRRFDIILLALLFAFMSMQLAWADTKSDSILNPINEIRPPDKIFFQAAREYIFKNYKYGLYHRKDKQTKKFRKLKYVRIQDQIIDLTQEFWGVAAEFEDVLTAETVVLHLDLSPTLEVSKVSIYRVDDEIRFTYAEKGQRVPMK